MARRAEAPPLPPSPHRGTCISIYVEDDLAALRKVVYLRMKRTDGDDGADNAEIPSGGFGFLPLRGTRRPFGGIERSTMAKVWQSRGGKKVGAYLPVVGLGVDAAGLGSHLSFLTLSLLRGLETGGGSPSSCLLRGAGPGGRT